jgi:hypothetical protein
LTTYAAWERGNRIAAQADLAETQADLNAALLAIEDQQEVARVHRAHLARLQQQEAVNAQLIRELEAMEGGDAQVSDYLNRAGRLLWP